MPFSRALAPARTPDEEALTRQLVGIGMAFAAPAEADANIENSLLFASVAGLDHGDLRILAVLTTWLGVHAPRVLADRLVQIVAQHPSARVQAYWAAIASWLAKDRRFARLAGTRRGAPRVDLLPAELARVHRAYRWRLVIGPTYRADMWAALESDPGLSAADLARRTYGSFPTAWHVRRDFATWRAAGGRGGAAAGAVRTR
jgi:hypothetical protein